MRGDQQSCYGKRCGCEPQPGSEWESPGGRGSVVNSIVGWTWWEFSAAGETVCVTHLVQYPGSTGVHWGNQKERSIFVRVFTCFCMHNYQNMNSMFDVGQDSQDLTQIQLLTWPNTDLQSAAASVMGAADHASGFSAERQPATTSAAWSHPPAPADAPPWRNCGRGNQCCRLLTHHLQVVHKKILREK